MKTRTVFAPELSRLLPETHVLLQAAPLVVHPAVERVVLTGSRGVGGGHAPTDRDLAAPEARGSAQGGGAGEEKR